LTRRNMLLVAAACTLVAVVLAAAPASAGSPFRYPEGHHGCGELQYINGLPVLTVAGTPEEMGKAVGVLAVRPAEQMLSYPDDLLDHFHCRLLRGAFLSAGRKMFERVPPEYQTELAAAAEAGGVERDRLILGNTLFDLKKIVACSALLVEPRRSTTGGPLLGRNLDYPSLGYAQEYGLVTVYRPGRARHAFASVGFPGLVGCLSGMNDAGLAVTVLEVFQVQAGKKRFDPSGIPYARCYRRLLEECATISEAQELLRTMKQTTTTNLAVADREGVAVFEITPTRVEIRPAEQGTCICTNHFCTEELRPFAPVDVCRSFERFEVLAKASRMRPRLSPDDLHHALHAVSEADKTMQTMVFEPAALRLFLALGTCPASSGELRALELSSLLRTP
jgi:isopenicillin-N N-acyltransferase like protein